MSSLKAMQAKSIASTLPGCRCWIVIGYLFACLSNLSAVTIDPKADELIQSMSRTLAGSPKLQTTAHALARMETKGMLQEMSTTYDIVLQRPNKIAVRSDSSFLGSTIIDDGTTLTRYNNSQKTFKSGPAPPELQSVLEGSAGGITGIIRDPMAFVGQLLGSTPYETVMHGVTAAQYIGKETMGKAPADHLQLSQDHLKWDLWLTNGDKPLPLRAAIDLTSIMIAGAAQNNDRRFTGEITFSDWQLDPVIAADAFVFVAPEGAKPETEVAEREEPVRKLLGNPAPDFKLPLLDGGEANLQSLKGKVVVLDFWATWCGPCRMALPIVSSTALAEKSSGVEFFAVNLKEEESEIRTFLKEAKLSIPVALDKNGDVGDKYKVEGIPQTVLIGKDGTVQVAHVGFSPDMKGELKNEIESLVAGKSLVTSATVAAQSKRSAGDLEQPDSRTTPDVKKPKGAPDAATSRGVELVWSLVGPWTAIASESGGSTIFAADLKGEGAQISTDGKVKAQFKLPGSVSTLRAVNLAGQTRLLGYQSWGRSLSLFDSAGKELWSATVAQGISEVSAADNAAADLPALFIATNGDPGLQALKADGTESWKSERLPKGGRIDCARFSCDGQIHVLATSADGKIHDFSSTGSEIRKIDAKLFATLVRVTRESSPTMILAGGTTKGGEGVAALNCEGKVQWITPLSTNARAAIDAAAISPDNHKAAIAIRGSAIHVLNLETGEVIATVAGSGLRPEIAWLKVPEMLLIASGTELRAIRLTAGGASGK